MMLDAFLRIGISHNRHLLSRNAGVRKSQCQYLGLLSAEDKKDISSVLSEPWQTTAKGTLFLLAQDRIPYPANSLLWMTSIGVFW